MYSAEISRKNPGCFIFLLDQSASMEDPFGGSSDRRKADELATIINKLLHNLSIRCAKGDSIYDYFHVGVIGYGQDTVVKSAFDGAMTGKDLVPISELANNPLRIEDRVKKADDGNGGLVEQSVKFPLWFEAKHAGGTPMSSAFKMAAEIVQRWVAEHPKGFPPIVINITDGESTDGDPLPEAKALCSLGPEFFRRLGAIRRLWRRKVRGRPLPWYAAEKAKKGAYAAFVGASLNAVNRAWRAVAIGDCCLFHVTGLPPNLTLAHAFPLTHSEEFGSSPFLVGSLKKAGDDPFPHVRVSEGVLQGNDALFFASDALAAWLLRRAERGEPAWEAIGPQGIRTEKDFEGLVAQAREDGTRNDDMTLVRLTRRDFGERGPG